MDERLTLKNCEDFTCALASSAPVPGGGGAAALTGALAAALCSMAGNLTAGKKKYIPVEAELRALIAQCQQLREGLLQLIDEDAQMFAPLSRAYSIPKDDPARPMILEEATLSACQPPLEIMRLCCRTAEVLERMAALCSPMLLSDVGCGAFLCRAALESAAVNVFVNTRSLKDQSRGFQLEQEAHQMLELWGTRAQQVGNMVLARLCGKT